ncbi:MAG TPA: DUF1499 domain-containing protein [Nitrospirota bacterium]|nr:DUF1499 domain-containing protein [Nitrospirota bacterium]
MNAEQHAMKHAAAPHISLAAYLGSAGLVLAMLAGIVEALAGPGSRMGWWYFRTGFTIFTWAGIGGAAAAVISLIGAIGARPAGHRGAFYSALAGVVIGLLIAAIPWAWMRTAERVPKIHDITTDTANPPQFEAILPLRKDASNSSAYGGQAIAAQQQAAYPDIKPVVLPIAAATAFDRALIAARNMGWRIVSTDPAAGRIEATATTFWFGFTDDIVVRITPAPGGSRIDMRSESRVGLSDMGTNAARIRKLMHKLEMASIIDPKWNG